MRASTRCATITLTLVLTSCDRDPAGPAPTARAAASLDGPSVDVAPLTTLACGATITTDVTLANDLTCAGNALLVSGDDIRIDLNGHTIAGGGAGNGITISASHRVTIFGGSVRGFVSGIFVASSTGVVIRDNEFSATNQAVLFQATTGSVIKHNTVTSNLSRAFMLRPNLTGGLSTDNVVIGNLVVDTPTGIYLIRQPGNTIQNNTVVRATIAGLDLIEGAGEVSDNVIRANHFIDGGAGIRFTSGWIHNMFVGNRIEANLCGTVGPTTGNTFNGNVFSGNASDTC
jgi:parallel beta-helix repeat protein